MDDSNRWICHEESGGSRSGAHLPKKKETLKYVVRLQFPATNNEKEYKALLTRLSLAKALGAKSLIVQANSQLIIGQVKGDYEAK